MQFSAFYQVDGFDGLPVKLPCRLDETASFNLKDLSFAFAGGRNLVEMALRIAFRDSIALTVECGGPG